MINNSSMSNTKNNRIDVIIDISIVGIYNFSTLIFFFTRWLYLITNLSQDSQLLGKKLPNM